MKARTPDCRVTRLPSRGLTVNAKCGLATAVLFGIIAPAHANAGTGIMFFSAIHFVFLNVLLGIGEGIALFPFLQRRKARVFFATIAVMIATNYVSGFIGLALPGKILAPDGFVSIFDAKRFTITASILAYALTLFCEWPFFAAMFYLLETPHALRRSIAACFIIQTISCAILSYFYYTVVIYSLPPPEMLDQGMIQEITLPGSIHYISPEREWCSVRLNGSERTIHKKMPANLPGTEPSMTNGLDLQRSNEYWQLVSGNSVLDPTFAPGYVYSSFYKTTPYWGGWSYADFRPEKECSEYSVEDEWGFGVNVDAKGKRQIHFCFEPLFRLEKRFPMSHLLLPEGIVVFQCHAEIVVLDIFARKAGVLARGYSPIFLPENR